MLSVANVRTAGGAANYFAADNYYTRADADRLGEWVGKGAEILGLDGRVDAKQFEAILKGLLPDGSRVGSDGRDHRAGTDLTFSMPKSWSLIALVGGDNRMEMGIGFLVAIGIMLEETHDEVAGGHHLFAAFDFHPGLGQILLCPMKRLFDRIAVCINDTVITPNQRNERPAFGH